MVTWLHHDGLEKKILAHHDEHPGTLFAFFQGRTLSSGLFPLLIDWSIDWLIDWLSLVQSSLV